MQITSRPMRYISSIIPFVIISFLRESCCLAISILGLAHEGKAVSYIAVLGKCPIEATIPKGSLGYNEYPTMLQQIITVMSDLPWRERWIKEFLAYSVSKGYSAHMTKTIPALCPKYLNTGEDFKQAINTFIIHPTMEFIIIEAILQYIPRGNPSEKKDQVMSVIHQ